MKEKKWDVFISHADPDKADIVIPLAEALRGRGVRVWLDQWAIDLGASIAASISDGLAESRFGVVVLSHAYFGRAWPKKELGALFAQEGDGASHIVPIWHGVNKAEVLRNEPLLADRKAARSDEGIATIVERIIRLLERDSVVRPALTPDVVRALTKRLFPDLPIDEFWQTQLLADLDVALYRSAADIERAYKRARRAVEAFASEEPVLFRSGTDYLTKSLGFVDLCFRSHHSWAAETRKAFVRHADKVQWDLDEDRKWLRPVEE